MKLPIYDGRQEIMVRRQRWVLRVGLVVLLIITAIHFDIVAIEPIKRSQGGILGIDEMSFVASEELIKSIPVESEYGNVTLEYVPLPDGCRQPAPYKYGERANLCWYATRCASGKCGARDEVICAPNIMLIGVIRSGTADMAEWFDDSQSVVYDSNFEMRYGQCAVHQAESSWRLYMRNNEELRELAQTTFPIFSRMPAQIFETQNDGFTTKLHRKLRVRTAMQHLHVITTSQTRFILILRDPVSRALSHLYYLKENRLLKDRLDTKLNQHYIHTKMVEQMTRLNKCFRKYGPRACIYQTPSQEGNIGTLLLWGLYVEYIEEALKFIERDQLHVVQSELYKKNEFNTMDEVFGFAEVSMLYRDNIMDVEHSRLNANPPGQVKPWKTTRRLLEAFYSPFNARLVKLLGSTKWCFSKC